MNTFQTLAVAAFICITVGGAAQWYAKRLKKAESCGGCYCNTEKCCVCGKKNARYDPSKPSL